MSKPKHTIWPTSLIYDTVLMVLPLTIDAISSWTALGLKNNPIDFRIVGRWAAGLTYNRYVSQRWHGPFGKWGISLLAGLVHHADLEDYCRLSCVSISGNSTSPQSVYWDRCGWAMVSCRIAEWPRWARQNQLKMRRYLPHICPRCVNPTTSKEISVPSMILHLQ